MHDPFAMRPFFGYNFGKYMEHWLSMEKHAQKPKIFHVNWFRKDENGKFIWPGFGENARVLEWIFNRVGSNPAPAEQTAIGYVPKPEAINTEGLGKVDMKELFHLPKDFWVEECKQIRKYYDEQLPEDLPAEVEKEWQGLVKRVNKM